MAVQLSQTELDDYKPGGQTLIDSKLSKTEFNGLLANAKPLDVSCIVAIHNTCRSGAIYIGGACQFRYQNPNGEDDGMYTDYHKADVGSGGTLTFQSDDPTKCVKEYRMLLAACDSIEDKTTYYGATETTDKMQCLTTGDYDFGPKQSILRSQPDDRFELKKR
jgi:hypothetical protein